MKAKLIIIVLLSIIAALPPAFAKIQNGNVQPLSDAVPQASDNEVLTRLLAIPSPAPRGPQDRLQEYEAGMAAIAQQFSAKLQQIVQGVQNGQLSREEGEHISGEQYQVARMQFELLSAWHEMLRQDLARTSRTSLAAPEPTTESQVVMVPLPFSSLQLNPTLAQYLDLSSEQISAIEELMSNERRNLEPLMTQMQTTKQKLLAASEHRDTNQKEIKALAAAQARMLTELIVANSRMQAKLYKLLSPQQQKKLDAFKQSSELSARAAE